MLVLSRKQNETIVIDGQIKIEVLKVKGNTIKLGITAPSDVKVLRGELAPFGKETATFEMNVGSADLTSLVAQAV